MWNSVYLVLQGQILPYFMAMQFHRHYQLSFVLQKNFIDGEFEKQLQVKISFLLKAPVLTQGFWLIFTIIFIPTASMRVLWIDVITTKVEQNF